MEALLPAIITAVIVFVVVSGVVLFARSVWCDIKTHEWRLDEIDKHIAGVLTTRDLVDLEQRLRDIDAQIENWMALRADPVLVESRKETAVLTEESAERRCGELLAEAWNVFVKLGRKNPTDNTEFCAAIHAAQNMLALRVARRVQPDYWAQPED